MHTRDRVVIHRDIKPENIMIDDDGSIKIADFGWSNYYNEGESRFSYCGTPEYLAPEMIQKHGHGPAIDLWNLGILTYELLNGKTPFSGNTQTKLFNNIMKLNCLWPKSFPEIAKDFVRQLMQVDPKSRPSIEKLMEHSWFHVNQPLRPIRQVLTI